MNARELYEAGRLTDAVAASLDEVKRRPTDTSARGFLCELLCLAGDMERADKHLDVLADQEPEASVQLTGLRQILRAEAARQQFFSEGRLPEFLDQPTPILRLHLEASIALREGQPATAVELLAQAEAQRTHVSGTCDGQRFDDLRDLDDLTASFFEVLTSTGKYFWIPTERIEHIEFHRPARARDLVWRRASMTVRGGPDGDVFVPAIYAGTAASGQDALRLGRQTDFTGGDGQPVRGLGQRTLLVGETDQPLLSLGVIEFDAPAGG